MLNNKKKTFNYNSAKDKFFVLSVYIFLTFCLLIVLYPLIYIVSASFSSPEAVIAGKVWFLPVEPTLIAYKAVFGFKNIISGFINSFIYTIAGTFINLIFTILAAYPLSSKKFVGRKFFSILFIFTMYFSGGLVPTYLLICKLQLVDTRAAMILPGALSVWYMIICRTFLQSTIPDELYNAAELDGCGELRSLVHIVLPLSKPILAVLALYYGVAHWNSYFSAMIYLSSQDLFPLQLVLRTILVLGQVDITKVGTMDLEAMQLRQGLSALLKYAVIVVASVPLMCLYPFAQKYFVKGVMIGSLKG